MESVLQHIFGEIESQSDSFLSIPDPRALRSSEGWVPSLGLGGSACLLRQLWLPCLLDFGSPFCHPLHHSASFTMPSSSSLSVLFHSLAGANLCPNYPDHILLQPFLDAKSRLSLAGRAADSRLGQQDWSFHFPSALVQGEIMQQGADGSGRVILFILHWISSKISRSWQPMAA